MNVIRSPRWIAAAGMAAMCLVAGASPARGQGFYELGAGWNFVASPPASSPNKFTSGLELRGSIGQVLAPRMRLRFDANAMLFGLEQPIAVPCPSVGCPHPFYTDYTRGVVGLTANGLLSLDPRGIVYVIGGAGVYDANVYDNSLRAGVSAGAGLAIPIGPRHRAVVEAAWHGLAPAGAGPRWLAPVTVGLRF
jgi:hypothetical protein